MAPVFLFVIFAIIDFGALLSNQISLTNAARNGARYYSLNKADYAGAQAKAIGAATGLISCSGATATGTPTSGATSGTDVSITVSCTYAPITPFGALAKMFGNHSVISLPTALSATTKMVVE